VVGLKKHLIQDFLSDIKDGILFENVLGGGLVFLSASLYFFSSPTVTSIRFRSMDLYSAIIYLYFLLIEGLFLWTLFFTEKKHSLWWYCIGFLLIFSPLIMISTGMDFCMRASIPSLFLLMCWSGESLFRKSFVRYRGALILLLILGAFTPLYEINRSVYRTISYYLPGNDCSEAQRSPEEPGLIQLADTDHPCSLTANLYPSLMGLKPDKFPHRTGKTGQSIFFKYLANPPK
jgi:hypothetical protein